MTKWHKGPPPSIGWWPASMYRDMSDLRWWNGRWWSIPANEEDPPQWAAFYAKFKALDQDLIKWTDRPDSWPQRSKT